MSAAPAPVWRYERKFLLHDLSLAEVQSILRLHPALFSTHHPARWVNNVYLDDRDLGSFRTNVDGTAHRTKVRIRWYGDLFGQVERPTCEVKIKRGLVGTKRSHGLAPFPFGPGFGQRTLTEVLAKTPDLPAPLRPALQDRVPVLVNRYHRRYLLSADGRFRVTLDTDQLFLPVHLVNSTFLSPRTNTRDVVLELKYAEAHDDEAAAIVNRFPFRLTNSSKYVSGVQALYE